METEYRRGRRRDLVQFAMELVELANGIAALAEREVEPYCGPPVPRQLAEVIEARKIRERMFNMDLTHPGWTFLLDLYRAHLEGEGEPVALEGLRADVQLGRLASVAIVKVEGPMARLTDFGVQLMEQQFKAEKLALQLLV